jgi:hypothetical protein
MVVKKQAGGQFGDGTDSRALVRYQCRFARPG